MTLESFINQFDHEGAIVLLEGKREVRPQDQNKLIALGNLLASNTKHMIFRSGNAPGSDQYFAQGVCSVNDKRLQVIIPYTGHRKTNNKAYESFALDQIDLAAEPEVVYQSKSNKKTKNLIDNYANGIKNQYTLKAAYIIRDTIKAIGTSTIKPTTCAVFYDDLDHPRTGGTGHTMNICLQNKIPVFDQSIWFNWV